MDQCRHENSLFFHRNLYILGMSALMQSLANLGSSYTNFYLTFTLENWFPNIEIFYFVQTYSGGGDQVLWFLSWGCQWEQKNWPRPWRTDRSDDDHDLDEIEPQKWSIVWFWDFVPISLPDCSECGRSGHPSCLQFTRWMPHKSKHPKPANVQGLGQCSEYPPMW